MSVVAPLADPGPEVRWILGEVGYADDLIRNRYSVWIGSEVIVVPVVAFARRQPQDMTTATILAAGTSNGRTGDIFAAARAIASPAVMLQGDEAVEVWNVPSKPGAEKRIDSASSDDVGRLISLYRSVLNPDALYAAKRSGRQLTLFPVDVSLLTSARNELFNELSIRVEEAVLLAMGHIPSTPTDHNAQLIRASQVVVASLATLVMRDKFALAENGLGLFDEAESRFPQYFRPVSPLLRNSQMPTLDILEVLGAGINFQAMDPTIVSRVYEEAIVDQAERIRSGIFYTPPELAGRIMQHVPVEELEPDHRLVLDPACGSGTLLLAAHDRLQSLVPAQWEREAKHAYVTRHLHGIDKDQFAVDIARLALLLHALPEGNSWDIVRQDTLSTSLPEANRPTIIVSNPPWKDTRSRDGKRHQTADDFLRWMIRNLQPSGFYAIVLPSAWLSSTTSAPARTFVREQSTVFEIWRLTEDTFASAAMAPCVLFGQLGRRVPRPWMFRRVLRSDAIETFYKKGSAEETYLGSHDVGVVKNGTYLRGPLDEAAPLLLRLGNLGQVATVQNGPVPEPPVAERGGTGEFLWLKSGSHLRPFANVDTSVLVPVRFPDDFHRAGTHDGSVFRRRKLLVSADRSPANPWRLKVGVDTIGAIPRNSLHMVIPRNEDPHTLYALLAILGSAFTACWVDSYETKLAIDARVLRELPLPPAGEVWDDLARAGRAAVDASGSAPLLAARARELDAIVLRAYGLPPEVRRRVTDHFSGFIAPEGAVRYPPKTASPEKDGKNGVRTFGAVLAVESDGRLRIWVPGFTPDEGTVVAVPARFLGWHCIHGSTFDIVINESLLDAEYSFQRRSYQHLEQDQADISISDVTWQQ